MMRSVALSKAADKELTVDGCFGATSTAVLQTVLAAEGFLDKAAVNWDHWDDGRFGPKTKTALRAFLTARGYDVGKSNGWCGWPRQSVKALQMWARDSGAEPGPIDGRWGRRTSKALQTVLNTLRQKGDGTAVLTKQASASTDKEPLVAAGMPLLEGMLVKTDDAAGAA